MHIPDGYLDPAVAAATYVAAIGFLLYALRRVKDSVNSEAVSTLTVLSATIFAAQMLNWPIPGGTSLHFVGGGLAGILLGPWLGFLAMFLVLLIQCLVFHDGGITALGANVLNMAVVSVGLGFLVYRVAARFLDGRAAGFLAGWLSTAFAGLICGLELGFSTSFVYGLPVTIPVMGGWHLLLGVVEGVITGGVVEYVKRRAPYLMLQGGRGGGR